MFKHQLLMALDEARVYSRQCFLKSLHIMPLYLQTCVDTYAPEGKLLFDDYHFGLSELYDPQNFFKDARLHKTLFCLGLLWVFYVIGYSPRLAPVRPSIAKLSLVDFIDTTAQFFARRVGKRQLAEALVKQLLVDICQRRHLAGETQALLWLSQHSQITTRQLAILKLALAKQRLSLPQLTNTLIDIRTTIL